MHRDNPSGQTQTPAALDPITVPAEPPRRAPGVDADVLRAATKVLDRYAASLQRSVQGPGDAGSPG